jgi:nitrogen fixation protein FixH
LGWRAEISVSSDSDIYGFRNVTISLQDANQAPIEKATIELTAFHRARAAEPQAVNVSELSNGIYSAMVRVQKSGLWQFDGSATKGDDTLLINERQSIKAGN